MEEKQKNQFEKKLKQKITTKRFILPLLAMGFLLFVASHVVQLMKTHEEIYDQYTFRVTRKLVKMVTEAKALLEKKGDNAFPILNQMKSDQLGLYLYVYRLSDGQCLYHGENPGLVGTRLNKFTDQLGKPLHKLVSREIKNPRNPHGWVHSSNVGLAAATRAVSRWIGVCMGVMYILAGCFPVIATAIALVPSPVMGAAVIFAICFMILTGIKEMLLEPLDQRNIAVAGMAISFGLSTGFVPELFAQLPSFLQPLFSNPLAAPTILGIIFYQIFHINIHIASWQRRRIK